MDGCNLNVEPHGYSGLIKVSCVQCGHSQIMKDLSEEWGGVCGREQEIVDDILSMPKCYKTGGICRYECGGLCKDSC